MNDAPYNRDGAAKPPELTFLHDFVCECPDPSIRTTIRALVDLWLSRPTSTPHLDSLSQLQVVLNSEDWLHISWLLAINPNTPASVLQDLCSEGSPQLLERIAENGRTSPSTLTTLSCQAYAEVRIAAASNPNTPLASIMVLINDLDADVRYSLAENHQLDKSALDFLSHDENAFVKFRAEKTISRLRRPG